MPIVRRGVPLLALAGAAFCHEGEPLQPHDLPHAWTLDPFIVLPMLLAAALYWRGATEAHGIARFQRGCFWAGWLALFVALMSPLHAMGESLFSAHMLQHEILMLVGGPLLVLGRPLAPFLWGFPLRWRKAAGEWSKARVVAGAWSWLTRPANAWWIHAVALWGWHIPRAFEATVENDFVHSLQHMSFLGTALIFWWALLGAHDAKMGYGKAVFYVFSTGVHSSVLGAWLTFSPFIWYPIYRDRTAAWGLTPLEDQQLGGLIMWVPPGLVFIGAGLYLFAKWIEDSPLPLPRDRYP